MNIQELGKKLERELIKENIPYVTSVTFDDFNSYEGRMFVDLKMEGFGSIGGKRYVFHDVNDKGILGKISGRIRKVVTRTGAKITSYVSPKKMYSVSYGMKSNDGYSADYIQFDFVKNHKKQEVEDKKIYNYNDKEIVLLKGQKKLGDYDKKYTVTNGKKTLKNLPQSDAYEYASKEIDEIGKMTGGWLKVGD